VQAVFGFCPATKEGRTAPVEAARSYLFDAQELVAFGVAWIEEAFG
jgi:hypothetical protein